MKIIMSGLAGRADGSVHITYYGPQNPDGTVPTKTVVLIGDKDTVKLFDQKSDQKVKDELDEILDSTRVIDDAPTLDADGKLDPPGQTYTPDAGYDQV